MKIVQIITLSEPIGGAQMVLFNTTKAMVESGHEVHIMVGDEGSLTERLAALKVPVTCIPTLRREISPINDFRCYRTIKRQLQLHKPDMVISHSSKAGILCRLACHGVGVRNIFTAHGWSFTPGIKGIKRYVFLAIEKVMGWFTDHVITVSEFDRKQALKYSIVPDRKMKVIYNGSPDLLQKMEEENQEDSLRILMVARFQYPKDHLTLFSALSLLKEKNIKVDLVGSGEYEDKFKKLAQEMGIASLVEFHGESNRVNYFLNRASIFILTSKFEALPLSICEAMSVGIPILASDVGGIHEMVTSDYNGYLIPKEDHSYLADRINHLINNTGELQRLGANARKTFDEKFSIEHMYASTENYINHILSKETD